MLIDRLEKAARIVLWLAIAALCVLVPVGLAKQADAQRRAAQQAATALADEAKAKEAASVPRRMSVFSMGDMLTGLHRQDALGAVWFSNVSPRSGFVCVQGTATGQSGSAKSLPACIEVKPYDSAIKLAVMFAGASLAEACEGDEPCRLTVEDAPDAKEGAAQ